MSVRGHEKEWLVGHNSWNIYTDYGYDDYITHLEIQHGSEQRRQHIDKDLFALCVMSDELIELLTHIKDMDEFPVSQLARDFLSQWRKMTEEVQEKRVEALVNYENYKDEDLKMEKEVLESLKPGEDLVALQKAFDELGDDDEEESEERKS